MSKQRIGWVVGLVLGGLFGYDGLLASEPSKILKLEEMTVSDTSGEVSPPPPSATIITIDDIQDQRFDKTLYVLQKVPGVSINDYGQGAVASQFTMRGLRLGHNTGVAIFVDGVPINESTSHGDGYGDFNTIIPEDIEYIEVIKGPSSALYGQFARAGVVNIVTRRSGDFGLYKLGAGDFNRQRFAASAGHRDGDFQSVLGVELSRSQGATDHSAWQLGNATGKFSYKFNPDLTGALTLNMHTTEWDHPEYLKRDQWDAGNYWSAKPLGGGQRYRYGMSTNWTYNATANAFFNLMLYGYTMNLTRYRDLDSSVREEYHDREMYGCSSSYVWNAELGRMKNNLTVGVDGQVELTHTINADNPGRIATAREHVTVDGKSNIRTYSAYFQNDLALTRSWKLTLGARFDHVEGELDERVTAVEKDMKKYDIFSPKAGLAFTPIDGYTLFSTYGEGFQLPNGFDKFNNPNLKEEIYSQYELGFKSTRWHPLEMTLTGFILDIDEEIVIDAVTGTKENQGKTRRKGAELEVSTTVLKHLSIYGLASYTKGEYEHYIYDGIDYSGTDISLIPEWVYSFGAQWKPDQSFFAGFDYRYVGEGRLDNYAADYTGYKASTIDYWVADAQIGYRFRSYSLSLDAKNIFDERYPSTETATSLRTANPRSFFVTVVVNY
ncbi:MAG: TonB-dependent receptor [Desulfatitalea sp.]|nr:TonB-dependent receptor [Desulfatitalea sp.]NNK02860.1 TonB-dependent receptor [Desulfatitalea sp.]